MASGRGANETDQFITGPFTVTLPSGPIDYHAGACFLGDVTASVSVSSSDGSDVVIATGRAPANAGPVTLLLQPTGATLFEPGAPTERSMTLFLSTGPMWASCEGMQATVDAAAINVVGLR